MAKSAPSQAASRLPSTRESRPALIGLALLLIVGGALASGYLALVAGHRAEFVKVSEDVAMGDKLTEDHLEKVSLPEGYDDGIPAGQMDDLLGQYATVRLLAGTVLTPDMVRSDGGIPTDQVQFDLSMGQPLSEGLQPGAALIIEVGGDAPARVPAELVRMGSADEGGIGTTSDGRVPVTVQFTQACSAVVAQAKLDNATEVGVGKLSAPDGC